MSGVVKRLFKGKTGSSDTGLPTIKPSETSVVKWKNLAAFEHTASPDDALKDWYCAGARYFKLHIKDAESGTGSSTRISKDPPVNLPRGLDGKGLDDSIVIHIAKSERHLYTNVVAGLQETYDLLLKLETKPENAQLEGLMSTITELEQSPESVPPLFPVFLNSDWIQTITKLWIEKCLTVGEWNESWRQVFKKIKCLKRLTLELISDLSDAKGQSSSTSSDCAVKDFKHRIEKISVIYESFRRNPSITESVLDEEFVGCCAALVEKSQVEWLEKSKERGDAVKPELCFECRGSTSMGYGGTVRALDGFRLEYSGSKCTIKVVNFMETRRGDIKLPLEIRDPVYGELNVILGAVKPSKLSIPSTEFLGVMTAEATSNLQQLEVDTTAPLESSNALIVVSNLCKNPAFVKLTGMRIKHRGREKAPPLKELKFKPGSQNSLEGVTNLRLIRSIEDVVDSNGSLAKDPLSKSELGHSKSTWELMLPYFVSVKKFTTNGPRKSCISQARQLYKARPDGSPPALEDVTMYIFPDEYDRFWAGTRIDWQFKKLVIPNQELVEGFNLTSLTVYFNKYWDQRKALKRARAMVKNCGNAGTVRLLKMYPGHFKENELMEGLEKPDWLKVVVKADFGSMLSDAFKDVTLGWT